MANSVSYYVASTSTEGMHHRVRVWPDKVTCECGDPPKAWCSHIEATLVAGERAMVFEGDRKKADAAMALFKGQLVPPPGWKAYWRRRMRWRGLAVAVGERHPSHIGESGRPVVCFTGSAGVPRAVLLHQADAAGWEAIDTPHSKTTVLVAADPDGKSTKLRFARRNGIPILSLGEWDAMRADGVFPDNPP